MLSSPSGMRFLARSYGPIVAVLGPPQLMKRRSLKRSDEGSGVALFARSCRSQECVRRRFVCVWKGEGGSQVASRRLHELMN
jgi:hypothetical protein